MLPALTILTLLSSLYLDPIGTVERFPLCHSARDRPQHSHLPSGSIGHTIAVLPGVGARAELVLVNTSATETLRESMWALENAPDYATVCALRVRNRPPHHPHHLHRLPLLELKIEACANCLISMDFETGFFADSFKRQVQAQADGDGFASECCTDVFRSRGVTIPASAPRVPVLTSR